MSEHADAKAKARAELEGFVLTEAILVVVPALDEAAYIRPIVLGLALQAESFPGSRIVVVDGGSTDGTYEIALSLANEMPNLAVLRNPRKIQAAALNLAARTYGNEADILVRCDAHGSFPPNFLASLVKSMHEHSADTIVVSLRSSGTTCTQKAIAWISDTRLGSGGSSHRGGLKSGFVDHGHHAAFRMSSFVAVGGYNETFAYNEDAELDCRFREGDYRIYLDASIDIVYFPRKTFTLLSRQYRRYGQGRAATFLKHPSSLKLRQIAVPVNSILCLGAILISFVTIFPLAWPLSYIAVLIIASMMIAIQRRTWCGLLSGLAGFVMHQSWAFGFVCGLLRGLYSRTGGDKYAS